VKQLVRRYLYSERLRTNRLNGTCMNGSFSTFDDWKDGFTRTPACNSVQRSETTTRHTNSVNKFKQNSGQMFRLIPEQGMPVPVCDSDWKPGADQIGEHSNGRPGGSIDDCQAETVGTTTVVHRHRPHVPTCHAAGRPGGHYRDFLQGTTYSHHLRSLPPHRTPATSQEAWSYGPQHPSSTDYLHQGRVKCLPRTTQDTLHRSRGLPATACLGL